jgi:hypothetical protein
VLSPHLKGGQGLAAKHVSLVLYRTDALNSQGTAIFRLRVIDVGIDVEKTLGLEFRFHLKV